ncbi:MULTISPECIES: ParA family protein [Frankia]|uniref:ParA family protein n=1 Tax=Frankia TaxID=1854 RepID=UPI0013D68F0D|nr:MULTISPECIES: ParA family protein [Frankia]
MARTIAIANQKGGVGKTSTTVNLGAALAEAGVPVLAIDLDAQRNATDWLRAEENDGLYDLLTAAPDAPTLTDLAVPTEVDGLSIVPATRYLAGVERAMAREPVGAETVLRQALAAVPPGRWDVILLDCPPSLGLISISALVAAGEVLVPTEAGIHAVKGLAALLETVDKVRASLNPGLTEVMVLPVRVDRTRIARQLIDTLHSQLGEQVLTTVIRDNVRLREAPGHRRPVTLSAPTSPVAEDYRALAVELRRRAGRPAS